MSFQMFNKAIVPTTALTVSKSFPFFMTSIDGMAVQPIYTDGTPTAVTTANTAWNTTTHIVTATAHGLTTGLVGQFTTTGGLPAGISALTNYWIIRIDANSFAVASSLNNALAGTKVAFTTQGTGNHTFTPTALSWTLKLQASNDGVNWVDIPSTTIAISAAGTSMFNVDEIYYNQMQIVATATSGVLNLTVQANAIRLTQFQ